MPDPHLDTAEQRPAMGLDAGARRLMAGVIGQVLAQHRSPLPSPEVIVSWYFHDRYGGWEDYFNRLRVSTPRGSPRS
jgi:hypothetical protein